MRKLAVLSFVVAAIAVPACSSKKSDEPAPATPNAGDTRPPTPPEWDRTVVRPADDVAAASRASCTYLRGALPDETLGASVPMGKDIPLDSIIILMQENRSFDSYFGHYPKFANRSDVEVAKDDATNPTKTGADPGVSVPWQHQTHLCFDDTSHSWKGSHLEWDEGKNDGFVEANDKVTGDPLHGGARAMWWLDERELGYYYALASAFGIADHYHCSLLGPTWPNRMFLFAATSFGNSSNFFPDLAAFPFPDNDAIVLDELEKRHVDWKLYTDGGPPGVTTVVGVSLSQRWGKSAVSTMDEFRADAAAGTLPPVAFIDANFLQTNIENSTEHPPANPQFGQKFIHDVVQTLFTSKQWSKLAFFATYDEHGGLFDHVPPPPACNPDGKPPKDDKGNVLEGGFDRYGFRVPLLVVSPFAKKGYVGHGTYDHTSLLRLIQARHRLPALTTRDANADIPLEFFDFASPPNLVPPTLPDPTIDPAELAYCHASFPNE